MWSYQIDQKRNLVITTAWDVLTREDVLEHRRKLTGDAHFRRDFFQLLDFSRVTDIVIDHGSLRTLAREHLFSPQSRRAFVAPSSITYGMARMFVTIRELAGGAEPMKVFDQAEDALRWLFASCGVRDGVGFCGDSRP